MKTELVEQASEILDEIKSLEKYKEFLANRSIAKTVHFEIACHYGDRSQYEEIRIDRKHNSMLFEIIDSIIVKLKADLENL